MEEGWKVEEEEEGGWRDGVGGGGEGRVEDGGEKKKWRGRRGCRQTGGKGKVVKVEKVDK